MNINHSLLYKINFIYIHTLYEQINFMCVENNFNMQIKQFPVSLQLHYYGMLIDTKAAIILNSKLKREYASLSTSPQLHIHLHTEDNFIHSVYIYVYLCIYICMYFNWKLKREYTSTRVREYI